MNTGDLPLTGERTMPGIASENYWFRRHEAAYLHLRAEIRAGTLLEIGAGEGYGAAMFSGEADRVVALDYDASSIGHLARTYPQLYPVRANLAALPIASESVDAVVGLQVIEHVWDHRQFIAECRRVLRPGGPVLISTPNRLTFSPGCRPGNKPQNPFHTHEFTASELMDLIGSSGLLVESVRGLHGGPAVTELDVKYRALAGRSFAEAQLTRPPQEWTSELARDVASISASDFVVRAAASTECLDLILLARQPCA